jgi:hypothetical protein
MSFFVKAVVEALARFPALNAEIRGTDIVYRNYYDIGIAVGGGRGLVVPVLRSAERLTFAETERAIADFARRAEANQLTLEELQGGTFTISNGGIYGSLLSTPIVNPPQSGILGLHAIQDRPMARDGQVVIRPMMYVALTYDHRVVDGREAVTFLRHVTACIEEPARILLEVWGWRDRSTTSSSSAPAPAATWPRSGPPSWACASRASSASRRWAGRASASAASRARPSSSRASCSSRPGTGLPRTASRPRASPSTSPPC